VELLHAFIDLVLHLDRHLVDLLAQYGQWLYGILFLVIFAETGLVVTPFLPGDSLLFALGALAAIDTSGSLDALLLWLLLGIAAVLGNSVNYWIGRRIGQHAFSGRYRFINLAYLRRTEQYFERHGAATIVLSRFAPIIRTFAPFVAGIGHMAFGRFLAYTLIGGASWVGLFIGGGYLFGNLPLVRQNFGFVTLGIIAVSMLPMLVMLLKDRAAARAGRAG
jgi:membrane-associated protein